MKQYRIMEKNGRYKIQQKYLFGWSDVSFYPFGYTFENKEKAQELIDAWIKEDSDYWKEV